MAAIKAVMREDRSSSQKNSRGRSRNRSRNGQRNGSRGQRSRTRDPTPVVKKEKKKPYTRPPILRAAPTAKEWQCANCAQKNWMTRKEYHQCHTIPPCPSNPVPPKEMASGSTANPAMTWANVAAPKLDKVPERLFCRRAT